MKFKAVNPDAPKFEIADLLGNPIKLGSIVAFGYGKLLPIQIGVVTNMEFGGFIDQFDRANLDIAVPSKLEFYTATIWEGTLFHKEYFSRVVVITQELDPRDERHRRLLDIQSYYKQ